MDEQIQSTAEIIGDFEKKIAAMEVENVRLQAEIILLRQLYERAPLSYQSLDENGCFLSVNQAWLDTLGYCQEEVIGQNFGSFLHPDWRDHFKENFPRFKAVGEILGVEFEMRKKDGSLVFVSFNGKIGKDPKGNFQQTYCIFQDITRQKQAEEALARSEEKWRNIIVSTPQIGISLDPQGRIVFANTHFLQMVGWNEQEVIGQDWFDMFIPCSVREEVRYVFLTVMGQKDVLEFSNYENEIVTRTGELRNVAWSNGVSKDIHGNIIDVTCLGVDLTERKRAEEALQISEARLLDAQNMANVGNWEFDISTGTIWASGLAFEIYGLQPSVDNTMDIAAVEACIVEREKVHQALVDLIEKDVPYNLEIEVHPANGKPPQIVHSLARCIRNSEKAPLKVIGVIQNITERKRAEAELLLTRFSVENAFDSMFWITPDARIVDCNAAACRNLGYPRDELLRLHVSDIDTHYSGELWQPHFAELRNRGSMTFESEQRTKDGRLIPVEIVANYIKFGGMERNCAFVRDITEHKRAEAEREKLQAQLIQAQKMESVGRLAGGVAHDFNNMLGVILGYSDLVLEQVESGQPIYLALQAIQQAAQRSTDLTRQLLTFARKQTVAPKVLYLNKAVEGMLNILRRLIGEDIDLIWVPCPSLWAIKMDPSQIDQILVNLCVNARDAIAGVGKITVETENSTLDKEYCDAHVGYVPGEYVRISVSDNGKGMDRETLTHIFEPFFTTKGVGVGTGLGLATVYGAVKQNNGVINVYSEPGQGTILTIYLPRHVGISRQTQTAILAEPALRGNETILLVEDEPMILEMVTVMLERLGYTVLPAVTPGDAIRLAQEQIGKIHLLMTDVVMPEMNGRDLASNLLSFYPDLKRIFMSGYTANVIAHHGVLDEDVHFIQKPFTTKDLAAKIRDVLD